MRAIARLLVAIALLSGLVGVGTTPAGALEAVTVTPDTGLVDGELVTVTGTGFVPFSSTGIALCRSAATIDDCDFRYAPVASAGADGSFTEELRVRAVLQTANGSYDCRPVGAGCVVIYAPEVDVTDLRPVPVAFDPAGPLLPPPTLAVDPSVDLVDRQEVEVTGTGFTSTSAQVAQCVVGSEYACRYLTPVPVELDGTFTTTVQVRGRMVDEASALVDCRAAAGTCELRVWEVGYGSGELATPLHFDPAAPLPPLPWLAATPDSVLVDGQAVEVSGGGFDLDEFGVAIPVPVPVGRVAAGWRTPAAEPLFPLQVLQCATGAGPSWSRCDPRPVAHPVLLDDGTLATTTARVWALLDTPDGPVDCRVTACELQAGFGNPLATASTGIGFDPDAPLVPPPVVTAEPISDLVPGRPIDIRITGLDGVRRSGDVVYVLQCGPDPNPVTGGRDCDVGTVTALPVDAGGAADGTVPAQAVLTVMTGSIDCTAAPGRCVLAVTWDGPLGEATFPLTYGTTPSSPPEPQPTTASPPPAPATALPRFTG